MNTQGFYKKDSNSIIFGEDMIAGTGYLLLKNEKDSYSYPVDGWIWAESLDAAIAYFASNNNNQIAPFDVQPENFRLATNEEDEAEFGKLVILINLSLQQNKIALNTPITIWDHVKKAYSVTAQRFLEIMVDYGMYCYTQRS